MDKIHANRVAENVESEQFKACGGWTCSLRAFFSEERGEVEILSFEDVGVFTFEAAFWCGVESQFALVCLNFCVEL